jgi:hypothetical protein
MRSAAAKPRRKRKKLGPGLILVFGLQYGAISMLCQHPLGEVEAFVKLCQLR